MIMHYNDLFPLPAHFGSQDHGTLKSFPCLAGASVASV